MKVDIKEIKINKLNNSITFINGEIAYSQFGVATEILNLITTLQEENEKIRKMNKAKYKYAMNMEDKYITEKAKNEKTIEYINKNIADIEYMKNNYDMNQLKTFTIEITYDDLENILNILQGGGEN